MSDLIQHLRMIPDYPKPGILYYDITTLLQNPVSFRLALDQMQALVANQVIDKVVGIESRGFIFAAALADRLQAGLAIARKPGKLPNETFRESYDLEYGQDCLEMHTDTIKPGENVIIVDDIIATGGTLEATCKLVEKMGGNIISLLSVLALVDIGHEARLARYRVQPLLRINLTTGVLQDEMA